MNAEENAKTIDKGSIDTSNFNKLYEASIEKAFYASCEGTGKFGTKEIAERLARKRQIGLQKYLGASFQFNLHNALNSPTIEHAMDELLDCMNYLLHEIMLKASFLYPWEIEALKTCFKSVFLTYHALDEMQKRML